MLKKIQANQIPLYLAVLHSNYPKKTFENLSKEQTNRIETNCIMAKKYTLISYNNCLSKNKKLALGGTLTQDEGEIKITSHTDKVKAYSYLVVAYWKNIPEGGSEGASGTGVAISKNTIATNFMLWLILNIVLKIKNKYFTTRF
mgnify:CR=1 FL=1